MGASLDGKNVPMHSPCKVLLPLLQDFSLEFRMLLLSLHRCIFDIIKLIRIYLALSTHGSLMSSQYN